MSALRSEGMPQSDEYRRPLISEPDIHPGHDVWSDNRPKTDPRVELEITAPHPVHSVDDSAEVQEWRQFPVSDDVEQFPLWFAPSCGADQGVARVSDRGLSIFEFRGIGSFGPTTDVGHERAIVPGEIGVLEERGQVTSLNLRLGGRAEWRIRDFR